MIEVPGEMTNAALWAVVVGFVQPIVLQFILQSGWSSRFQAISAFLFSVVTGGATAYFAGAFTGGGIITTVLLVAVVSISAYKGFWKPTTAPLKDATSVNKDGRHELTDVA